MLREVHKRHKFFMHEAHTMIFKLYLIIFYLHLQALQWDDGATGKFFQCWLQQNCVIKRNSLKHFQRVSNIPARPPLPPSKCHSKADESLRHMATGRSRKKNKFKVIWFEKSWNLLDSLVLQESVGRFFALLGWWCNKRETNKRDPFPSRHFFNLRSIFFSPVA